MSSQSNIRNFAIIAHIDHGKSTLADRLLEATGVVKHAQAQTLDSNPIEQERGITIKLAPVRMAYTVSKFQVSSFKLNTKKGDENLQELETRNSQLETFVLNLIDTPGHVDFSYEVSRALAACEGAILLVDATQGIQAQTMAHYREAKKLGLTMIPVLNKVDLATADVVTTTLQIMDVLGFTEEEILKISAKTGEGVEELLGRIIEKIPAPNGNPEGPLRALVFNSQFHPHQGVVAWVRVMDGKLAKGQMVTMIAGQATGLVTELGYFHLEREVAGELGAGEVGYVVSGLKDPQQVKAGDTLRQAQGKLGNQNIAPLAGYNPPKPMIFASFYPTDQSEYVLLGEAMDKLKLLDSSLIYTPESSPLLGNGFRVGFLGILHAEIVQERLDREFNLSVFASAPSVVYKIVSKLRVADFEPSQDRPGMYEREIHSPQELPDPSQYEEIWEPVLEAMVFSPEEYVGPLIKLFQSRRSYLENTNHVGHQVQMEYRLPLAELVSDFYSAFKSVSSGYASLDYQFGGWQAGDLVKLDIALAGDRVDPLSRIVPRDEAEAIGRQMVEKLQEIIPRHNFEIAVQAAVGGKILARSTVKPYRKDVTAKLYGGDPTRRDKLLKKQKKGKKRMKQFGKVSLPPDTFWRVLK